MFVVLWGIHVNVHKEEMGSDAVDGCPSCGGWFDRDALMRCHWDYPKTVEHQERRGEGDKVGRPSRLWDYPKRQTDDHHG